MQRSQPSSRKWSLAEYYRMAELGFFARQRVELVWGKVVKIPPLRNDHMVALGLAEETLRSAFGSGFWIRIQGPINLTSTSAPEPYLAVVPGSPRDYQEHPSTALLVVEVSDSTLAYDRKWKLPLYAQASIPEYWIINLIDKCLEVYRDPLPNMVHPKKSSFATKLVLHIGECIAPLARPGQEIQIEEMLP